MKIIKADSIGFCYGVDRAVNRTRELLNDNVTLHVMGEVVHNEGVVEELRNSGLIVSPDGEIPVPISDNSMAILRAHGVEPAIEMTLRKRFKDVVDLTCPIVYNVFSLATSLERQGYFIVIFGKKKHAETRALIGRLENYLIVEPGYNAAGVLSDLEGKSRIALLSQTTMDSDSFHGLRDELIANLNCEVKAYDTICKVTIEREKEATRLGMLCDAVVVVGGKRSSNTRKLYEIVKKTGKKAFHIQKPLELPDLSEFETVGIISGTSTPATQIQIILDYIESQYKGR